MSEQTLTTILCDDVSIKVVFDHQPEEKDVGLDESVEIEEVIVLNPGGFQMGDIKSVLGKECLDLLQNECFECMGGG